MIQAVTIQEYATIGEEDGKKSVEGGAIREETLEGRTFLTITSQEKKTSTLDS